MKHTLLPLSVLLGGLMTVQSATIAFQAESGTFSTGTDTFSIGNDANASEGQYITTSTPAAGNNANTATATYTLTVAAAGDYTFYARIFVPTGDPGGDDSFYAPSNVANGSGDFDNTSIEINNLQNGNPGNYFWVNTNTETAFPTGAGRTGVTDGDPGQYALSVGTTNFTIRGREDGLLIDAFVLDTDDTLNATQLDNALIPEPSAFALLMLGLGGFALRRRRA